MPTYFGWGEVRILTSAEWLRLRLCRQLACEASGTARQLIFLSLAYGFAFGIIKHQLRNAFVVVIPGASKGPTEVISAWWAAPGSIVKILSAFGRVSVTKIACIRLKDKMVSGGSIWWCANGVAGSEQCILHFFPVSPVLRCLCWIVCPENGQS